MLSESHHKYQEGPSFRQFFENENITGLLLTSHAVRLNKFDEFN